MKTTSLKSKLIQINCFISWIGLSVDTEHSSFLAVIACVVWFAVSNLLFVEVINKGKINFKSNNNENV